MNFTNDSNKQALPMMKIAIVIVVHAAIFALILNDVRVNIPPHGDPIVEIFTPPEIKQPEPQPLPDPPIQKPAQPPTNDVIQPPDIPTESTNGAEHRNPPPNTSDVAPRVMLEPPPLFSGGSGGNGLNRSPVYVAAEVNASACDKPNYPANSSRLGETGVVTLSMLIGTDGHVIDSKVEKSSGYRTLDRAAKEGLSLCKFKPGTIDGVAQQSWTKIKYEWSLD